MSKTRKIVKPLTFLATVIISAGAFTGCSNHTTKQQNANTQHLNESQINIPMWQTLADHIQQEYEPRNYYLKPIEYINQSKKHFKREYPSLDISEYSVEFPTVRIGKNLSPSELNQIKVVFLRPLPDSHRHEGSRFHRVEFLLSKKQGLIRTIQSDSLHASEVPFATNSGI